MSLTNATTTTVYAGTAAVLVEYEYEAGEDPIYNVDHPGVGPGCAACVTIVKALVNGEWIDPDGVFSEVLLEQWEAKIAEEEVQTIADAREEYECERWEREQDAKAAGWP